MTKYLDNVYLDLVRNVLENGVQKGDRTGTGTISTFGQNMRFDLTDGTIPLLTTKKMHTKSIIHELLWYLAGDTNVKYLQENGVRIWNEWADENGDLGPVYGAQWRRWKKNTRVGMSDEGYYSLTDDGDKKFYGSIVLEEHFDQIETVIKQLRNNPNDRRIIVSAWNVGDLEQMALPPCHAFFQFWSRELSAGERNQWFVKYSNVAEYDCPIAVSEQHKYFDEHGVPRRALSCQLYQRSCDVGLGVPFNVVQYSILTHMIAHVTGHVAEEFVWAGGDVHIYNNHIEQLEQQLELEPYQSPRLELNQDVKEINDFTFDDFSIVGYESHPTLKMEVSV